MIIQYGSWAPDQARFGNTCVTATNVYPTAKGYGPFADATAVGDALPDDCVGILSFKTVTGNIETFAGTQTKIYRRNGTVWDDASGSTYQESTFWRFAVYGDIVVATNGVDNPQKLNLTSGSLFFSDLSNAPKCRYFIVVKDVLVALDLTDESGFEVKWSAVNDSESWDTTSGGGSQNLPDGGPVQGGTGGEFGVILQEQGVTRMNFVGGDLRFTFDAIEGAVGCISPDSIVRHKGRTFYLSAEGFQVFDGAQSKNISDEVVSDTFFAALAASTATLITDTDDTIVTASGDVIVVSVAEQARGALDPRNSCVIWRYPTATASKLIIYNYRLDRWSESDIDVDCIHTSIVNGTKPVLAGIDSNKKLARFDGSNRTATVSTGDLQLFRDKGGFVSSVRGLVDSTHTITVGKKTDMADTETTVSGNSNSNGKASVRSHGRYHRFQVVPTAAFTELVGIDIEARRSGGKV